MRAGREGRLEWGGGRGGAEGGEVMVERRRVDSPGSRVVGVGHTMAPRDWSFAMSGSHS